MSPHLTSRRAFPGIRVSLYIRNITSHNRKHRQQRGRLPNRDPKKEREKEREGSERKKSRERASERWRVGRRKRGEIKR